MLEFASRLEIEKMPNADRQPVELDDEGHTIIVPTAGIKLSLYYGNKDDGLVYLMTRDEFAFLLASGREITCDA